MTKRTMMKRMDMIMRVKVMRMKKETDMITKKQRMITLAMIITMMETDMMMKTATKMKTMMKTRITLVTTMNPRIIAMIARMEKIKEMETMGIMRMEAKKMTITATIITITIMEIPIVRVGIVMVMVMRTIKETEKIRKIKI